jgi:tetratricopeptide (TPR) repeat protein
VVLTLAVLTAVLTPSAPSCSQDAFHYNTEGVALHKSGDYAGAVRMFERASSLAPDNETIQSNLANAHIGLATELVEANDLQGAIEELDIALDLKYDDAGLYLYTASLCLRTGDLSAAEGLLLSAIDISPEHERAHVFLGEVYYRNGYLRDAVAEWRWVVENHPASDIVRKRLEKAERELNVEKDFATDYRRRHFIISRDRDKFQQESRLILEILEKAYYGIGRDLRHFPQDRVQVILYSVEQFSEATLSDVRVAGLYDGKIRVPLSGEALDPDRLKQVLRHEYTHVLVRELTGGNAPFWFNEGLAQFEAEELDENKRRVISDALHNGGLIPLGDLDATSVEFGDDPDLMRLAYVEAFATVSYLRRRFSRRHLFDFMDMLAQKHDAESALQSVYRRNYDRLHRDVFSEYGR